MLTLHAPHAHLSLQAWGRPGKWVVDALLAINQIGWVPIYFIFVQQNLFEAIPALSKVFSPEGLMAFQLLIYVPLSWCVRACVFASCVVA